MSRFAQRNSTDRGKTLDDLRGMELPDFVRLLGDARHSESGRST
jgi:hypothetical protein